MVKWPKNDATCGNQYLEPNISVTIFGSLTMPISSYAGPKKYIFFVSNFTKIRINFKRENKKYFLCRNPGLLTICHLKLNTVLLARQYPNACFLILEGKSNIGGDQSQGNQIEFV